MEGPGGGVTSRVAVEGAASPGSLTEPGVALQDKQRCRNCVYTTPSTVRE